MNLTDIDWPAFGLQDDVRPAINALIEAGEPMVLATLFDAQGGSPRGLGAQMLFGADSVTGYLSGGCVEADVALHAEQVMASGEPRRLIYGHGGPADVRLPCGGRIEALLERIGPDDEAVRRLIALWRARRPALWLSDGVDRVCLSPGQASGVLPAGLDAAFHLALGGGVCAWTGSPFALHRRFDPVQRLVVIGSDPPAMAIAGMAAQVGLDAVLLRPKGPVAPPPLPDVAYLRGEAAEALAEVGLDPWTAIAVATHDDDLDEEALAQALPSAAGYVGVLGSRRRLPERLDRLRSRGVGEEDIARLRAPIGLHLAGKSPWEIAVSVVAEVIQVQHAQAARAVWPVADPGQRLHALVFGAGLSSRFGGPKLLAPWRNGRVLDGALAAAFASPAQTVTLVTGAHASPVEAAARAFAAARPDGGRLRIVHAPDYADGLSASIRRGVRALPADAEGAFLFLADMPDIPHGVLKPLAEALERGARAAAPVCGEMRGHPVLVSRSLFAELRALEGDQGAGALLKSLGADLALVEAGEGALFDIDAPADLETAKATAL